MIAILDPCEIDSDDCDDWQSFEDEMLDASVPQTLQASAQGAMYVSASGVSGMWGANVSFVMADSAGNKTYMDVINQQNHDFNNTLVAQDNQVALAKALLLDISDAASTAALASINANMSFQVAFAAALKARMQNLDVALNLQVSTLPSSDVRFSGVSVASLGSTSWERSAWTFFWGMISSLPIIGQIVQTPLFAQLTDYSVDTSSATFRDGQIAGLLAQLILAPMLSMECLPSYIGVAGDIFAGLSAAQMRLYAAQAILDGGPAVVHLVNGQGTWGDVMTVVLAAAAVEGQASEGAALNMADVDAEAVAEDAARRAAVFGEKATTIEKESGEFEDILKGNLSSDGRQAMAEEGPLAEQAAARTNAEAGEVEKAAAEEAAESGPSVSAPRSALGRGSTADMAKGTWLPSSLREQLAVEQAAANPAAGTRLPFQMTDSRWPASQGWVKMDQKILPGGERITVHYNYNTVTGELDDFKIVTQGAR